MITEYEKFVLEDEKGKGNLLVEVNWKPDDPETNESKVLRVIYPDKSEAYIKKERLNALLFAIGNEEEQRKMIPQKIIRSKWYETVVSVVAKKDIHKGENITFPLKITLPDERREAIAELKKEMGNGKSPILY